MALIQFWSVNGVLVYNGNNANLILLIDFPQKEKFFYKISFNLLKLSSSHTKHICCAVKVIEVFIILFHVGQVT